MPAADQLHDEDEKEMSFLDHLEELRWHIVRSAIAIVVIAIAAFLLVDFVWGVVILGPSKIDFITYQYLCDLAVKLETPALCISELSFEIQSRDMTGQFTMHILTSVVLGFVLAFPYVFWEIWRFVSPGLYPKERNAARGATFFVSLLFLSGVLFGYFIVAPLSINFLGNYKVDAAILNEFDIISYVNTLTMLVLACGLMFQLPIVVYFLAKSGLITDVTMKTYRKHSIVVILIVSAIITPPDVISQLLISFPMMFLYEVGIFVARFVSRKRKEDLA